MKYIIYMNDNPLEVVRSRALAELRCKRYEREDRYDVKVNGYPEPRHGYPVYTIKEVGE